MLSLTSRNTESFNTQPPEGGWLIQFVDLIAETVSTRSRPKAAGQYLGRDTGMYGRFQHAAARRRLVKC